MALRARIVVESHGVTEALVRNRARADRLEDLSVELEHAREPFREAVGEWFDSSGDGTWPKLKEATIAEKQRLGVADPEKPLLRYGALRESLVSSSGPYSFSHKLNPMEIVIGVDWNVNGWQIPVVLSEGDETHPARHIWPSHESREAVEMRVKIGELLLKGI